MATFNLQVIDSDNILLTTVNDNVVSVVPGNVGPQGAAGPNNLYVGPTPPANPTANTLWIDTTGL